MDLIRVEIKKNAVIFGKRTLLFTLLCFSHFVSSRPDCVDRGLVINSKLKRIKLISELQTEGSFSESWLIYDSPRLYYNNTH